MTGLLYLIVPLATAYGSARKMEKTHIASVEVPGGIGVFITQSDDRRKISFGYPFSIRLAENGIAKDRSPIKRVLINVRGYSWREYAVRVWIMSFNGIQISKPLVGLLHSIFPPKYLPITIMFDRWGFAKVNKDNVCSQSVIGGNERLYLTSPYIWPLVYLELSRAVANAFAGQASLPESNYGIDRNSGKHGLFQPRFLGFSGKVFLALGFVCGCVSFSLGFMLLGYVWRRMGLDGSANQNFMFWFGMLLCVVFMSVGQWILFSVLGLLP